jgi:hypothetical protein
MRRLATLLVAFSVVAALITGAHAQRAGSAQGGVQRRSAAQARSAGVVVGSSPQSLPTGPFSRARGRARVLSSTQQNRRVSP